MNKTDLIEHIAKHADISKAAAGRALESMIGAVKSTLKKGGSVSLVGFGTFAVTKRAGRTGRNPRTGEPLSTHHPHAPPGFAQARSQARPGLPHARLGGLFHVWGMGKTTTTCVPASSLWNCREAPTRAARCRILPSPRPSRAPARRPWPLSATVRCRRSVSLS